MLAKGALHRLLLGGQVATVAPKLSRGMAGSVPRRRAHVSDVLVKNKTDEIPRILAGTLPTAPGLEPRPPIDFPPPELSGPDPNREGPQPGTTAQPQASEIPRDRDEFWRNVPVWKDVTAQEFLSYRWSVSLARPSRGSS